MYRKQTGFTLMELMIVLVISVILLVIIGGLLALSFRIDNYNQTTFQCINELTYTRVSDTFFRQVVDEYGRGVRCK